MTFAAMLHALTPLDEDNTDAWWQLENEQERREFEEWLDTMTQDDDWLSAYDKALQQLYGENTMANLDEMVQSKSRFLKKEDVGEEGKNLTIKGFNAENIGTDQQPENGYVIYWQEDDQYKPMVLNVTNKNRLKKIFGTADTSAMIGKQINVYNDPFVEFQGELKGGLRLRPTKQAQAQAMGQEPQDNGPPTPPVEAYMDDIPGFE